MSEYEVVVYTRVRETYAVEADSEDEALERWCDGELVGQECESIEDGPYVREVGE